MTVKALRITVEVPRYTNRRKGQSTVGRHLEGNGRRQDSYHNTVLLVREVNGITVLCKHCLSIHLVNALSLQVGILVGTR